MNIKILANVLNFKNIDGWINNIIIFIKSIETEYINKLKNSATVITGIEILSFIIKYALAGWPPEAEGVVAEK